MAKDKLAVNPDSLESVGSRLVSAGESYTKLAKKHKTAAQGLSSSWKGKDASTFDSRMKSYLQNCDGFATNVQKCGLAIKDAAYIYSDAAEKVKKKAGK